MRTEIKEELLTGKFGKATLSEELKKYTSLRIGGPADILVKPETEGQISSLLKFCNKNNVPTTIIGNGSNLLIRDKGIRGVVIALKDNFSKITVKENEVYAQAGALLRNVSIKSFENELTGMEAVSGIPGSIGGAIVMNAGAYGTEMVDIVKIVTCADQDGNILKFTNEEMQFSYRNSKASRENLIVISVVYELKKGDRDKIYSAFEDFDYKRSSKQPLEAYSAGSTFKRPEGYYASKLIDDAGLRGYTVDRAMVSEKHCGFLINKDTATCENFLRLVDDVKNIIFEKYGVTLEREVKLIGEE